MAKGPASPDPPGDWGRRYLRLYQTTQSLIFSLSAEGALKEVTPPVEVIGGWPVSEWRAKPFSAFVHPEDDALARRMFERLLAGDSPEPYVLRIPTPSGDLRYVELTVVPEEVEGRIVGVLGMANDITSRKLAEEALRLAKEEYRRLVESVQAIVWRGEPQTFRFTFVSQEAETLLGYPVARWLAEPSFWVNHLHPEDRGWVTSACSLASAECRDHAFEFRMIAASGKVVWLRDIVRVICDHGAPRESVGVMIDITERRQAEAELQRSREQLADLSAHVEWAREEERTAIAREIHDELGQALTALKMDIALVSTRLQEPSPRTAAALERLGAMSELTEDTINRVRRIAKELRPGVLDDLGLLAALEWAADDFEARTGVACRVRSDLGDLRLPRDLATSFFRIFQEALTNVARHARARAVDVAFRRDSGRLTLELTDDGQGISDEAIGGSKSLGLLGMRERARRLGGYLLVSRAAGRGTRIMLSVADPGAPEENAR